MKVLSLFDGISCGMVALERAGIPVEKYCAYEIEPNAIKISEKNYPQIEHCGDVTTADFTQYKGFDLLLAGFPCQDLSINKANREGLKGKRSGLFWDTVRAIREAQPKYFLVENNYNMPKEDMQTITDTLGVEPILINSAAVSAQSRKRLYWTNIPKVSMPKEKEINVVDILENVKCENLINEVKFNGKEKNTSRQNALVRIGTIGKGGQGERVYSIYGKTSNLTANGGGRGAKTGLYLINGEVRKLTPIEAERAQTLPDNYTAGISDTKQKMQSVKSFSQKNKTGLFKVGRAKQFFATRLMARKLQNGLKKQTQKHSGGQPLFCLFLQEPTQDIFTNIFITNTKQDLFGGGYILTTARTLHRSRQ